MTLDPLLLISFLSAPITAVVALSVRRVLRSRWWVGMPPVYRAHWAVRFAAIATWVWFAVVEWVL